MRRSFILLSAFAVRTLPKLVRVSVGLGTPLRLTVIKLLCFTYTLEQPLLNEEKEQC